ncbi:sodium-independent anion transporter [Saccharospirillum sp. MSK14-1]|uniref:SulP family inorganic anion transporter n=1 Tax=Saccharospirillum sp. MSK14-1 TaxID=1897632 RepID=UPI000D3BC37D|nr:solute carrier family 26 protein [Saccharospirillum sp. MSK14-1]PTY35981.1 sodium-independent anion transporter [Saccharospirillum sp. MSK14-1]
MTAQSLTARLRPYIPALEWIPNYQRSWLRGDVIAGITTATLLVPQAMSYALLGGLPPYIGLYASVLPMIIYAFFGTSRQLAVGPVALVALLVASGIGLMAPVGSERYIELTILLSLLVGGVFLVMGIFRLGFLTNFLSHPVISGFTSAAALIIAVSQISNLLGLSLPRSENIAETLWHAADQWQQIHLPTLVIGAASLFLLIALKRLNKALPAAMMTVAVTTIAVWALRLDQAGVAVVGSVPAGLPALSAPAFTLADAMELLPMAIAIALIGFMESIAVARKYASERHYEINPNQELIGLGLANLVGAFSRAMPVAGGFGRTAVNANAGANTGLAPVITASLIAIALAFLTPLFYFLPKAALAAVIMVAVAGLIDLHEVKHLWKVKRSDLGLLLFTFAATLALGAKDGLFLAVGASMLWFVIKTTRPHYAVLGKLPGTEAYRNIERHPQAQIEPGILAIRFDAQFYYGNVSFLKDTIRRVEQRLNAPLRAVVLDACSINQLDSSADTALHDLLRDYRERDIELFIAHVKGPVKDVMDRSGFSETLGDDHFFLETEPAMAAARAWVQRNETDVATS